MRRIASPRDIRPNAELGGNPTAKIVLSARSDGRKHSDRERPPVWLSYNIPNIVLFVVHYLVPFECQTFGRYPLVMAIMINLL